MVWPLQLIFETFLRAKEILQPGKEQLAPLLDTAEVTHLTTLTHALTTWAGSALPERFLLLNFSTIWKASPTSSRPKACVDSF